MDFENNTFNQINKSTVVIILAFLVFSVLSALVIAFFDNWGIPLLSLFIMAVLGALFYISKEIDKAIGEITSHEHL